MYLGFVALHVFRLVALHVFRLVALHVFRLVALHVFYCTVFQRVLVSVSAYMRGSVH